jgi:general secretion pathway protein E
MRDAEAATIAIRAALTGHLVFSSLHAKDAIGTIVRMEEMGVEKYQISSALLLVVGQRLVRVLCKRCREPYQAAADALGDLGLAWPGGAQVYRAVGCETCDGTGYQGRTGIFEMLYLDEAIRGAINEGASYQQMFVLALQKGFRTYHEDGADKILNGITTVEEVLQAS